MKLNLFEKILGSGFYTGYLPVAPGTFGSAAAVLIYLIPGFENPTIMLICISALLPVGVKIGAKFEQVYTKDPGQFTLDEIVGTWISLLFVPKTIFFIIITFAVWRFMDIVKPYPARNLENLNGGLGIMLDDVMSSIYSLLLVQIIVYFTY